MKTTTFLNQPARTHTLTHYFAMHCEEYISLFQRTQTQPDLSSKVKYETLERPIVAVADGKWSAWTTPPRN